MTLYECRKCGEYTQGDIDTFQCFCCSEIGTLSSENGSVTHTVQMREIRRFVDAKISEAKQNQAWTPIRLYPFQCGYYDGIVDSLEELLIHLEVCYH